jgi:phosphatidate cytidylyltransferase
MLTGLLWNQWSFLVLFSIIHFGCWWEYFRLIEKIHQAGFHTYTKLGLMLLGYGLMLWCCGPAYTVSGYGIKENLSLPVSAAGFAVLLLGIFQKQPVRLKAFGTAALGLLYISLSWGLMLDLYGFVDHYITAHTTEAVFQFSPFNYLPVIIPLAIIWAIWMNDTMAYLVGSLIGKTPLTRISPKKTWEGTIGGVLLGILIAGFVFSNIPTTITLPGLYLRFENKIWFIIAAIAAIAGTLGDILESKIKRMAGVKDSGAILPGHGGFMDRFDSLLMATPFVWLYIKLFIN